MTWPAAQVAAEIRRRIPEVELLRLHKLLYYCQGHHAAHTGSALFPERVSAWDHGPVVGQFWHDEEHGVPVRPGVQPLDETALNTIGYVLSRYGRMSGHDLEALTHSETPWRDADHGRCAGQSARIPVESMADYFRHDGADSAGSEDTPDDAETVRAFLASAAAGPAGPRVVDTRESLLRLARRG